VPEDSPHRQRALLTVGPVAAQVAAYVEGAELLQPVVAAARDAGDRLTEAWARVWLGRLAVLREDVASAEEHLQLALALHKELGNPLGLVRSLALLGLLQAAVLGRRAEGEPKLEAAVELAHTIEDGWGGGFAHMILSMCAADATDLERTRRHCRAALNTPSLGPLLGVPLIELGRVLVEKDPVRALRLLGAAAAHLERMGTVLPGFVQRGADAARQRATPLLGSQAAAQKFEEGRRMSIEEAISLADAEPHAATE
jgi:tetratricopeptide (TPR) repeat protein